MSEEWCLKCTFWEEDPEVVCRGICGVQSSCITGHVTHQDFGCVHWKDKRKREECVYWTGADEKVCSLPGYATCPCGSWKAKPEPVKGCDTCGHDQWFCEVRLPKRECPHWQEKQPDLRERVARLLFRQWAKRHNAPSVKYEAFAGSFCEDAKEIVGIIREIVRGEEK